MIKEYKPSRLALLLSKFQNWLFFDVFGPKILAIRTTVNIFKSLTFLWVLMLMWVFNNISIGMWLYLFLHGSYGFCWLAKDKYFPDQLTLRKASMGSHIILFLVLFSYWIIPVPLALGYGVSNPSALRVFSIVCIYVAGLLLMMGADYQKYQTLKQKKGLISEGLFKYSRNPNYLGQVLIYLSFCLCSGNPLSFLAFLLPAIPLFALNIFLKQEISYKAKVGYLEYAKKSNILLVKVCENQLLDFLFYVLVFSIGFVFYQKESPQSFEQSLTRLIEHL